MAKVYDSILDLVGKTPLVELKRIEDFRKTQTEIEKRMRNQCFRKWITLRIAGALFVVKKII